MNLQLLVVCTELRAHFMRVSKVKSYFELLNGYHHIHQQGHTSSATIVMRH